MRLWGGSERLAWLLYLAVGLGYGPALAVTWFDLLPLLLVFLIVSGIVILMRLGRTGITKAGEASPRPLTLYWLLRAMMLIWWGCGGVVALAAAWWQPDMGSLFTQSVWLRVLALGGFLVVCVGILAEYSLPLLRRSGFLREDRERKRLGIILSSLAVLAAFVPFLLAEPEKDATPPKEFFQRSRAELLSVPVDLDPENTQIELTPQQWMTGLTHIFIVSQLRDGAEVPQGATVAQAVATDLVDLPYIFNLRAGIDTAEADLDRRQVATIANHRPSRVASNNVVYTLAGEAHVRNQYYTGLYLGREVHSLKSLRIRLIYKSLRKGPPVKLRLLRVFAY
jgi:hypothetical protein